MKLRYQRVSYRSVGTTGRQLNRMLDYLWDAPRNSHLNAHGEWRPPVDVFQTDTAMTVLVELAGMDEEDIEVVLFNDVVVITGERKPPIGGDEDLTYHEAGVRYGRFRADVFLPASVDRITHRRGTGSFLKIDFQNRVMFHPTSIVVTPNSDEERKVLNKTRPSSRTLTRPTQETA
ncbi:MAG: Hsp20/alpha crystallin family protein [Chloroflexia bacterium]